jgi:TRAP-type mannitol/chloroaromatic compound transport system permease small subunit
MQQIARFIDALNEYVGRYTAYMILVLIGVVGYEVLMRYAFNAPTVFAFELTVFLYGVHYSLTLGFAHKHDTHVSIDIFESRLARRPRTILRIITYLVIFLPTLGVLAAGAIIYAHDSWAVRELASSSWAPAIYPYKIVMAIGFVFWLLQGISSLIEDFRSLRSS